MMNLTAWKIAAVASLALALAGCGITKTSDIIRFGADTRSERAKPAGASAFAGARSLRGTPFRGDARARQCLMRAMYFESIRSSQEGLLAVGTVVMNRVESEKFPNGVCAVVSQKNQFAPGVMTRKMQGDTSDLEALAQEVLNGKRHPKIYSEVMFFHTAGLSFPYNNMHYVHVAGGNSFYEKRSRRR